MKKFYYNIVLFIFFWLVSFGSVFAENIVPYDKTCNLNSDCSAYGGCCMADIYSNSAVLSYYNCITSATSPAALSSCVKPTGSLVTSKCWPKEVCDNGLTYVINKNSVIDASCGEAAGYTSFNSDDVSTLKTAGKFCLSGNLAADPKLNVSTRVWSWSCLGISGGASASCSITLPATVSTTTPISYTSPLNKINGVCVTYSSSVSSEPSRLCSSGTSGVVSLNDGKFNWVCFGKNGGFNSSCSVGIKIAPIPVVPESDPFSALQTNPLVQPVAKSSSTGSTSTTPTSTTSGGVAADYPTIEQKSATINSYNLLEKYSSSCVIKFDSECEVLDQKFLDSVKSGLSFKEAISSGKLNGNWKVAKIDCIDDDGNPSTPKKCKEVDNYKTGFTLSNIQKLRKARVLPVGMELAALCIAGQASCADGFIYDGGTGTGHKAVMSDITLNQVISGYSDCNPRPSSSDPLAGNGPFCHLVNPNWILKDPKYMCESGTKNGPLLYVTNTQSQSNIRYEYCPDVSTCLSEKDNGDCLSYGYCLREKNIWRFNLSADSCISQNIGCTKYTYTMGGQKTTLGFIKDTTDKSVCDSSNAGCRKYSITKTGSGASDWGKSDSDKIFLNSNIKSCDSTQEGCTAFIRRDAANLVKNSSFEEYELSADLSRKNPLIWLPLIQNEATNTTESASLEGSSDNSPVFNGSNSLALRRYSNASTSGFVGYKLRDDYLVDVEPNKTYTLSYYVLGYNLSFTQNDLVSSRGAFVNAKEYDQNKTVLKKCTAGDSLLLGNVCSTNTDCGTGGSCSATDINVIDIEAFKYASTFMSSTWTRKKVSFKTSLNTYYLNIAPVLSNILPIAGSTAPATVFFDGLQLEEGSVITDYRLYENSKINYLKKAPDYANCYSTSSNKDKVFCSNFIKSCEKKDVGCRKYEKKDNADYWLPGKPNEENYCTSECKGYELYKESGPSYNVSLGSTFQSLIASTARSCDSSSAGCSEYKNLATGLPAYYSSVRTCLKESDSIGSCKTGVYAGKTCFNDDDCGGIADSCDKAKTNYVDYFTYTGSETSGYKLNVYRLLRTKVCSNSTSSSSKTCFSDADCSAGISCVYKDDFFSPATIISNPFDVCTEAEYTSADHNPNCREFHGPKDLASSAGTSTGDYVLYYANMSDVIYVSNKDCSYNNIVPYQGTIDKAVCDTISPLASSVRYSKQSSKTCISGASSGNACNADADCGGAVGSCSYKIVGCNIGIYLPESVECGKDKLHCREYKGTSTSSETLFSDSFEDNNNSWTFNTSNSQTPSISTEDIFVNEHSVKVPYTTSISKVVLTDYVDIKEKSLYKIHLYAKNDSASGELSSIQLKVGQTFSSVKQVNNDWRYISFDVFASSDITENYPSIQIINNGLSAAGGGSVNIFVDYISLEKSDSVYVIKDTWKTPVSCDNSIDNSTGVCNQQGVANGFCKIVPDKVCLTGNKIGTVCTASTIAASCGDANDTCDYPNKICLSGDNKNSTCNSDADCYLNPASVDAGTLTGSCSYTTDGYRLNLGKMIGCDEYVDSYGNDGFYVFNDLNLCSADKMGCEALYDTKNSTSYQKQEFNKNVDYSGMVAYYTFDDKSNVAKNDFTGVAISNTTNKVVRVSDGVSDGAALFNGSSYLTEVVTSSSKISTPSASLSIYGWIRPANSNNATIVSLSRTSPSYSSYNVSISSSKISCTIGSLNVVSTDSIDVNKWQNFICSYDGDRVRIYINGELSASSNSSSSSALAYNLPENLEIGKNFNGSMDDVRIYSSFFDSKLAYDSYVDYKDDFIVPADELGYYIVDNNYACTSAYKGCRAVGRSYDRYDASNAPYSTAYYIVDPDKFKSSGNYAVTGVYDGSMCKISEEGCYSFSDDTGAVSNFKFPKNVCVYRSNVDVGILDDKGNTELVDGWFKYNIDSKEVSSEGCYLAGHTSETDGGKRNPDSYKISKASDCEYKKDPVVVKRTFEADGTTRPKQTTYYVYKGTCSLNAAATCITDSDCSSGYCVLERTNSKCSNAEVIAGRQDCMPYGYDESPGIIDEFTNKTLEFTVCQSGTRVGDYCTEANKTTVCGSGITCGAPWTVSGWFKKDSTKGCSDDGDSNIEDVDYMRDYNDSVGICNEYGCSEFVEPTERSCVAGNLKGYECSSNSDCGVNGTCKTDTSNGAKYCDAINSANPVDKLNLPCVFDKDCGFGGICRGNNTYSYIKNSKINSGDCNGTVSRESGCILFNDTTDSQLTFSSKLTYAAVKNGVAVSAVTGDNSGGDSQKDSNMIIKVSRDRECSEWITFAGGSPINNDYDPSQASSNISTCKELSKDNKCENGATGSGWGSVLSAGYYVDRMNGNWFNEDFSGMAMPLQKSLDYKPTSGDYWWKTGDTGNSNTTAVLRNKVSTNNAICKSYPETDSPFNFSDKFDVSQILPASYIGTDISYNTYKNLAPRDYFKNVNTGITVPYSKGSSGNDAKALYRIDNNQDCYYQKVNYKDLQNPRVQYFGDGQGTLPSTVCYSSSANNYISSDNVCSDEAKSSIESKVADYTSNNLLFKGYCAEYDYSHEIYYTGSGKYNCITWVPGFMNEKP